MAVLRGRASWSLTRAKTAPVGPSAYPHVACGAQIAWAPPPTTLAFPTAATLTSSPTKTFDPGTGSGQRTVPPLDLLLDVAGSARTATATIAVQSGP